MLEIYSQGTTEVLARKTCSSANFCMHKSHINWPRIKPGPPISETGEKPLESRHGMETDIYLNYT